MLVVAMGLGLAALCALASWLAVIAQLAGCGPRRPAHPALALAMIAVGVAGSGHALREARRAERPSHDAAIVGVHFVRGGRQLLSLDAAGTLKAWDPAARAFESARAVPALAGASALLASEDGRFVLALQADGAQLLALEDGAEPQRLAGVAHAALLSGDEVALAAGRELRVAPLAAPGRTRARRELASPIRALASDAQGRLLVALEDGALLAIDAPEAASRERARLPRPARRLRLSPSGSWLVAVYVDARAAVVRIASGEVRALPDWMRVDACAFASEDALVFAGPGDPSALALSLADLRSEPWLGYGRPLGALAVSPAAPEAAVALGADLLLARAPRGGNAYTSDAARLVHRRS
jgi:hypothetical protein